MRRFLPACFVLILATPLAAAELNLTLQIPEQKVAEYHRPYAAIWIERADHSVAALVLLAWLGFLGWLRYRRLPAPPKPAGKLDVTTDARAAVVDQGADEAHDARQPAPLATSSGQALRCQRPAGLAGAA